MQLKQNTFHNINKFFTNQECEDIIEFAMDFGEKFNYNSEETWDCRRIYDLVFKEKIYLKLSEVLELSKTKNMDNINVSLTRYYDNRFLDLHLDKTSSLTTVIVLTENFYDGRFILSESSELISKNKKMNLYDLKIGEGITFIGNQCYHGVMPVSEGLRCALNIWINDDGYEFTRFKKEKTLL